MANIGSMSVTLRADTNAFTRGLVSARKGLASFSSSVSKTVLSLKGLGAALVSGVVVAETKNILNWADSLDEASQKVGMTVEQLHGLAFAAQQNGVEFNTLLGSLQKMNQNLALAAQGAGPAANALEQLGLSASQLGTMTEEQQFLAITDGLAKLGTVGERTAAAMAVFGRAGAELVPMVSQGSAGIRAMTTELNSLGGALSGQAAAQAAAANDAIDKLSMTMRTVFATAVVQLAPTIEKAANQLAAFFAQKDNIQIMVDGINALVIAFQGLGAVVSVVKTAFDGARMVMTQAITGLVQMLDDAAGMVDVVRDFGNTPIGGQLPEGQRSRLGERLNTLRGNLERTAGEQERLFGASAAATGAQLRGFGTTVLGDSPSNASAGLPLAGSGTAGFDAMPNQQIAAILRQALADKRDKDQRIQEQQLQELKGISSNLQGMDAAAAAF